MGKISPVSAKYIVHATIDIEGVVDRPDVIGAIFGQTEGLLGSDLELRELQRSGRIGRIEVVVDTRSGKSKGTIDIPSSLDKAETSIVAAALEIIQRIGPCNAKIAVQSIEDVRVSKRSFVIERAKELLKNMMDAVMPDSQEIADEVAYSVRVMEIKEYGKDRLPAGPAIDESDEIIIVEGRADVLNLLKHGIKNSIALNGTSVPETIIELCKKKEVILFVDGDRGGLLNAKALMDVAEIDFITRAPDGKEVEEITKKEIHKALRSKIAAEQAKHELNMLKDTTASKFTTKTSSNNAVNNTVIKKPTYTKPVIQQQGTTPARTYPSPAPAPKVNQNSVKAEELGKYKDILEDLIGTRGAVILNEAMEMLGKVPLSELETTLKGMGGGIYAVIFDGLIDLKTVQTAEKAGVKVVVGMDSKVKTGETRMKVLTVNDL